MIGEFVLPLPPSVNHLYSRGKHGVWMTAEYATWKQEAEYLLKRQLPTTIIPPPAIKLVLAIFLKQGRSDLDNYVKALQDAIFLHMGLDDKVVHELHCYKLVDKKNPRVEGIITAGTKLTPLQWGKIKRGLTQTS